MKKTQLAFLGLLIAASYSPTADAARCYGDSYTYTASGCVCVKGAILNGPDKCTQNGTVCVITTGGSGCGGGTTVKIVGPNGENILPEELAADIVDQTSTESAE